MTVKEVLALAAENLGREDLSAALSGTEVNAESDGEIKSLLRCYNLIENEVALDYFPLKREESFMPKNGRIDYTELSAVPVDFFKVEDESGADVRFVLHPAYLSLPDGAGKVTVQYAYSPKKKGIDDESEFSGKISARLLAYGVVCEFCLTCSRYAEAALWEKRFRDALRAAEIIRRRLKVRTRRWA